MRCTSINHLGVEVPNPRDANARLVALTALRCAKRYRTCNMANIRQGLALLRQPDFARLFAAYLITFTGSAMTPIAVAFGMLALTGSTRDSAIVIAAPTAAQIVILLLGGALADRASRRRQMVFAESMAATSQALIAILFLTGTPNIPVLALLMLVTGAAHALNSPAATGLLPELVARHELQAANSLLGSARSGAFMLGAALAGILVATVGAGITIAIDAATFVVSALLIASLRPAPLKTAAEASEKSSIINDLKLGWREFTAHQWLWTIVLQFSLVVAAGDAVYGLLGPAVAKAMLGGPEAWGFIAASMGAGTIVGGIVSLRLNIRRPMLFASWLVFFFAALPLALSVPLPVWALALAGFTGGLTGQMFAVLWYTTMQTEVPAHLLSRVSAYDHLGSIALAPLGIVVGGFLYEAIGYRDTLLIAAATTIIATALVLMVPGVRKLTVDPQQHAI